MYSLLSGNINIPAFRNAAVTEKLFTPEICILPETRIADEKIFSAIIIFIICLNIL